MELKHSRNELRNAEKAFNRMHTCTTLEDLEDEWKNFLNSIEKVWTKVERECQDFRGRFQPWQGKFTRERRKDQLLKYLKHARNIDQHTIEPLLEAKPGKYEAKIEGPVHIEKLRIEKGQIIEYQGSKPLQITIEPGKVELVRIKDNGEWYNPPINHKGTRLLSPDPFKVAELAIHYYKDFIEEAEEKF